MFLTFPETPHPTNFPPTAEKPVFTDSKAAAQLSSLQALEHRAQVRRELAAAHGAAEEQAEAEAPRFVTVPRAKFATAEGRNVHFEAKVEPITDPTLQIEWLRDGKPITVGHRFRPTHDFGYVALDIIGTIAEDSGRYTCRAVNLAGSAEFSLLLECHSKRRDAGSGNRISKGSRLTCAVSNLTLTINLNTYVDNNFELEMQSR